MKPRAQYSGRWLTGEWRRSWDSDTTATPTRTEDRAAALWAKERKREANKWTRNGYKIIIKPFTFHFHVLISFFQLIIFEKGTFFLKWWTGWNTVVHKDFTLLLSIKMDESNSFPLKIDGGTAEKVLEDRKMAPDCPYMARCCSFPRKYPKMTKIAWKDQKIE